ncbi:restriction endonuclease [Candidatus Manganitrophus noduliformans]|uniref:Restriction endonuclease n=1 Tax=Candidatus Manganitrophus noduliformans TaxID=2606439 RepID=A0A7X6DSU5_9BACT|nr:restriction endonuclease [Candidatus Manganitrophus noduliformans]NKE72622.1 restriction endonuclease [Candidatus Manganitrophus noduliformans]
MPTVTAQFLRDLVSEGIAASISMHRASREANADDYVRPEDEEPTDDEIDDFLFSNPLLDGETVSHLTDPGLLGFFASTAVASDDWLFEFREHIASWADTQEWQAADLVFYHAIDHVNPPTPDREVWTPNSALVPAAVFLANSPSHLLLADKLLREGKLLSELGWRQFEHLIAELLETHGWNVTLMQGSRDGGIDVLAERVDPILGALKAIWQAKKYSTNRKVQLSHLRELSAVVERDRVTKGIIVTTSTFTRGAIEWVQRDTYRLDAKDGQYVERWVRRRLYET